MLYHMYIHIVTYHFLFLSCVIECCVILISMGFFLGHCSCAWEMQFLSTGTILMILSSLLFLQLRPLPLGSRRHTNSCQSCLGSGWRPNPHQYWSRDLPQTLNSYIKMDLERPTLPSSTVMSNLTITEPPPQWNSEPAFTLPSWGEPLVW